MQTVRKVAVINCEGWMEESRSALPIGNIPVWHTPSQFFMAHKTRGLVWINTCENSLGIHTSLCKSRKRIMRYLSPQKVTMNLNLSTSRSYIHKEWFPPWISFLVEDMPGECVLFWVPDSSARFGAKSRFCKNLDFSLVIGSNSFTPNWILVIVWSVRWSTDLRAVNVIFLHDTCLKIFT